MSAFREVNDLGPLGTAGLALILLGLILIFLSAVILPRP